MFCVMWFDSRIGQHCGESFDTIEEANARYDELKALGNVIQHLGMGVNE